MPLKHSPNRSAQMNLFIEKGYIPFPLRGKWFDDSVVTMKRSVSQSVRLVLFGLSTSKMANQSGTSTAQAITCHVKPNHQEDRVVTGLSSTCGDTFFLYLQLLFQLLLRDDLCTGFLHSVLPLLRLKEFSSWYLRRGS